MNDHGSLLDSPAAIDGGSVERQASWQRLPEVIAILVVVISAGVAFGYSSQPLLEEHGFRQTHTALTAYWFQQNGISLAYETPLVGAPWSIPFEAPIYQAIVAVASSLTGASLSATGRIVSWLFLVAGIPFVFAAGARLKLDRSVVLVFLALWLSTPIYLFWGRSFLIETAVMFFVIAALPFALDVVMGVASIGTGALAGVLFALATVQKPTGSAVPLLVFGVSWLISEVRRLWSGARLSVRTVVGPVLCFAIPLGLTLAWTSFADGTKKLNEFGAMVTSKELTWWTFGDLSTRTSGALYSDVIWQRLVRDNAGGVLGIAIIAGALCFRSNARERTLIALCLLMFVLPPLVFANLHIVHTYYQTECGLFGAAALAIALGAFLPRVVQHPLVVPLVTVLFVGLNLMRFTTAYGAVVTRRFPVLETRSLNVAEALKRYTPRDSAFVAFGYDWSGELGYYAERKSFTVPDAFPRRKAVWRDPQAFLGGLELGAIVVCPSNHWPTAEDVHRRYWSERRWSYLKLHDCEILFPAERKRAQPVR